MSDDGRIGRRDALRSIGLLGAGATIGPAVASLAGESSPSALAASATVRQGRARLFTILHTTDIHAQLHTHDEFFLEEGEPAYRRRGGFAVLKTMIDALRAERPESTVVVDGGDCFQGGGVAAMSQGRALIPLMNRIGYDVVLPGNWEVVYGKAAMLDDLGGYRAAKICANMLHAAYPEGRQPTGGAQAGTPGALMFPPWWTTRVAGVRIGFIGYNDPLTPRRQSPAYSYGMAFTRPEATVAQHVRTLRDREGCAMVFLVTHMGLAQQVDLAGRPEVDGVDLILGADTHERVRTPIAARHCAVTEPGAFGSFVGRLDVVVEDGRIKDRRYALLDVDPERYPPDPQMTRLIDEVSEPYRAALSKVVGRTTTTLVRYYVIENPMDNLITDALMWKLAPDVAISNGFRFCPPIVASEAAPATLTEDDLWRMVPVDSEAKYGEVTGRQLWDWLEQELHNVFADQPAERIGGWVVRVKGMTANFTMRAPRGRRVNWVRIGGEPLDPARSYVIGACEREGDPEDLLCRLDRVRNPRRAGVTMHAILREYLQKFSPVSPKVEGRMTATDAPQTLLSQLEGFAYEFR